MPYKRKRTVSKWQEYREATLINSLVRGFLGRSRAKQQRNRQSRDRDMYLGSSEQYTGDPNLQWLQSMAGAGGRPMAAGDAIPNPLPYAGGTAVARDNLPGHANMGARIPVGFIPTVSDAINTPNQRSRFNKEQKSLYELLKRKS